MGFLDWIGYPREQRDAIENPAVSLGSAEAWASVFNSWSSGTSAGVTVNTETALGVPSVWAAVSFLSRTLASLSMHAYRRTKDGSQRLSGNLQLLFEDAVADEWTSYQWREYLFWQVFTEGRGLSWIERDGNTVVAIWPMETSKTTIAMRGGKRFYTYTDDTGTRTFPAADVIDIPFALKPDRLGSYSPIDKCRNAIGLSIAMERYAGNFFNGGGVPPLALIGPLPAGPDAMRRAQADINRSVQSARDAKKPIFPIPAGHELKPVGFDPEKGQMTDARRMQIEEIARAFQLPPVFLQDLTRATFSNAEQQDLHLVKHLIGQWATKLEQELNLKLFGRRNNNRYVEHNLDSLLRGDFKTRAEAVARLIQVGAYTPSKGGEYMGQAPSADPAAHKLYMQGAMVPLGTAPKPEAPSNDPSGDPSLEESDDENARD